MLKWSDAKTIQAELEKRWQSGRILQHVLAQDDLFPLKISLKRPQNSEINTNFSEIFAWIKSLKEKSKQNLGHGYELVEKEIHHRQSGRNVIPTHVVIPTVQDALRLLKKEREAKWFGELTKMIMTEWPILSEWVFEHPIKVLEIGEEWNQIVAVLKWFSGHHRSGLYLRQLDISGIDTKFIEQRKSLFTKLLDIVLPEQAIDKNNTIFELRYGLQMKPIRIRFRLLDPMLLAQGVSDMEIPLSQFAAFSPAVDRVFITENEINGLAFPPVSKSLVVFRLGYGLDVLKFIPWLRDKDVYYWGDIDTHGFAMLNQIRHFLPQTKSLLMNETVLLDHKKLWSDEDKPVVGELTKLTGEEKQLFVSLQDDKWGKGVRLEQERIAFNYLVRDLDGLSVL
ncbi:Wadjet anti-phage system protein JetD domain-containing protein [Propionispora vibrioides]|uniref:Wadjet protein JetD C-terminal domain-containing protein n=1 Tax=Propionispora vibrioides TaxID=112903 RepID=A0A1H8SIG8_9FIRM|nr:Wadjet anti-phage system protein JetD domain-containing protein [Propionispora vibrioides]SEO78316.1 hypothetical protein SAMN04490178_10572 [Propionispora vibrioides]